MSSDEHKYYIQSELNPILEKLIKSCFDNKPENVRQ